MGDRAVFGFKESKDATPVWLYSHWGGSSQRQDLAQAIIQAKPRWSDSSYATRIAMSTIIGDLWSQELNFGISAGESFCMPDYDYVLVVVWDKHIVEMREASNITNLVARMSFDDFIDLAAGDSVRNSDEFVNMIACLSEEGAAV